ncbi:hypothetical protein PED39_05365 [Methanomassiliicoccales archaeon LGM-RCC1]|nr:hypothetical protein PED39_05365 [Methanomassiliicoccales archaeon LGM-RCC1]
MDEEIAAELGVTINVVTGRVCELREHGFIICTDGINKRGLNARRSYIRKEVPS